MSLNFISTALLAISIATSFIVEGVKKLLDKTKLNIPSNLLAAIVSIIITVAASVAYIVLSNIAFSATVVVEVVIMSILSFLVSTIGYDKVIQMLKQFSSKKDDNNNDSEDKN